MVIKKQQNLQGTTENDRASGAGGERARWWRFSLSVAAGCLVRGVGSLFKCQCSDYDRIVKLYGFVLVCKVFFSLLIYWNGKSFAFPFQKDVPLILCFHVGFKD
jgi:hypothetical protein